MYSVGSRKARNLGILIIEKTKKWGEKTKKWGEKTKKWGYKKQKSGAKKQNKNNNLLKIFVFMIYLHKKGY